MVNFTVNCKKRKDEYQNFKRKATYTWTFYCTFQSETFVFTQKSCFNTGKQTNITTDNPQPAYDRNIDISVYPIKGYVVTVKFKSGNGKCQMHIHVAGLGAKIKCHPANWFCLWSLHVYNMSRLCLNCIWENKPYWLRDKCCYYGGICWWIKRDSLLIDDVLLLEFKLNCLFNKWILDAIKYFFVGFSSVCLLCFVRNHC